jgi:hypothetical protein
MKATDRPEKVIKTPMSSSNQKAATLLLFFYYNLSFLFLQVKLEPEVSYASC